MLIELKRRAYEIFYFREQKECDFVIRKNGFVDGAIQVCHNIDDEKTKKREHEGLLEALVRFSLKEGLILTERQEKIEEVQYKLKEFKIIVKPIWKWLIGI